MEFGDYDECVLLQKYFSDKLMTKTEVHINLEYLFLLDSTEATVKISPDRQCAYVPPIMSHEVFP